MTVFAAITGLVSVLVGWLVTARLSSLARRTRQEPERLLALTFGGLFCVGYPLSGASRAPGLTGTHEGALLFALGALDMVVGIVALGRFPQVVFRPTAAWARALSIAITLLGTIGGVGCAVAVAGADTRAEMVARIEWPAIALCASVGAAFGWNALESFRYWQIMKRRMTLELARPDTTHRFLLWGVASATSTFLALSILAIRASGTPILSPTPMAVMACSVLVTSFCWWLAFFMPAAYRRRVLGLDDADAANGARTAGMNAGHAAANPSAD
jgi:hypothetical protein